jgi:hypothetical protein
MTTPSEKINLAAHLEGTPALYQESSQNDTARSYAKRRMKDIRLGIKLSKEDGEWLNLYNNLKKRNKTVYEEDEDEESSGKQDAYILLLDKIEKLTSNFESRIEKLHLDYRKQLAEKDKRIDDILAKQSEQKDKDFKGLLEMMQKSILAGTDRVDKANDNATRYLVAALDKTNSVNSTMVATINNQWQAADTLGKKRFDELSKMLDAKEKDEPGFFDHFVQEIIIPNQDKIGKVLSKLAGPLLTE